MLIITNNCQKCKKLLTVVSYSGKVSLIEQPLGIRKQHSGSSSDHSGTGNEDRRRQGGSFVSEEVEARGAHSMRSGLRMAGSRAGPDSAARQLMGRKAHNRLHTIARKDDRHRRQHGRRDRANARIKKRAERKLARLITT